MNRVKSFFVDNKYNYLYLAFLVELLLVFYLRNDLGFVMSPIAMVSAGLFLAYYPILLLHKGEAGYVLDSESYSSPAVTAKVFWFTFISIVSVYWIWSGILFKLKPLDISQSDIIPFIKEVYLDRLFNGQAVYSSFTGFNYGTFTPSYLPAHWLPFAVPYLLAIDLRWATVGVFTIANILYANYVWKMDRSKWSLVKLILPWVLLFSIYIKQPKDAAHTIEVMVVGYYLILGVLVFSSNVLTRTLGVILPLFSRYAFLFWIPVYAILQWLNSRKVFTTMLLYGIALTSVIFLPFVIQTPEMYKDFNGNYLHGVINEWQGQSWQKPGDRPFQLFQGMGVASWFYYWFNGTLTDKINAIKNTLLIVSVIFMMWQIFLFIRLRLQQYAGVTALLTLKAALTIFYIFIMVPYVYLNWVPLIVSVVIVSRVKKNNP